MIYLTKTDEDKTKILVNHRMIVSIEKTVSKTSNVFLESGKIMTVIETDKEIIEKIQSFEAEIIKKAFKGGGKNEKESGS